MRSHCYSSNLRLCNHLGIVRHRNRNCFSPTRIPKFEFHSLYYTRCRLKETKIRNNGCSLHHNMVPPRSMDEGSFDISPMDDWGNEASFVVSSSEGEESDGEILVTPINDVDMPNIKKEFINAEDALTVTAHRLAMLGRRHKKYRIRYGFVTNMGLMAFLTLLLAFVDWCAWRIVRLPLEPFYFMRPFFISAILVACTGYISVPLLKRFNICQRIQQGPVKHYSMKGTPTMGGLFFVPIGVVVAKVLAGFSSCEVSGVVAITLAFAVVGLLDDTVNLIKNYNFGLSGQTKILLEVACAAWFSFWLDTANISSPYGMKMLVPLPPPYGLLNLGKSYLLLSSFSLIFTANGVSSTDGLDGLAGGAAALAFVGMSIAVLPICPDLSVFGSSMAGACVGFLLHNRYKASVFMGSTGMLALGGALAAMASCSGMFIPLFIASGIFILEMLSMIMQVCYFSITKSLHGTGCCLFRMVPLHYHLELCGLKEPFIVAGCYVLSSVLAVVAGYVGLISA
ncbi:hypothetical protein Ancab_019028 [Ancistrocladus abbreviatus]